MGTFAGTGNIGIPTVLNGSLNPSLGGSGLTFGDAGNLTMNAGSTFVLQASGGTVGVVQNVATFSYDASNGTVNLAAIPLDGSTTLNGSSTYTFLTYNAGPAAGLQSNWTIVNGDSIIWAGTGDGVNWGNIPNWSGMNASGGTVNAVSLGGGLFGLQVSGVSAVANGPQPGSSVVISNSAGATVTGPAGSAATNIGSLTLGFASGGPNVLNLGTSPFNVTGLAGTTINATGVLNVGSRSSLSTISLKLPGGSASVVNGGTLTASGGRERQQSGHAERRQQQFHRDEF